MDMFQVVRSMPHDASVLIRNANWESLFGRDEAGRSLLHIAVAVGNQEALAVLLDRGCDVNAQDGLGQTPLHYCAEYGNIEGAKRLLEAGANPDVLDRHGNSAIWSATFNARGKYALLSLILRYCSRESPGRENLHGMSPIGFARQIGDLEMARLLSADRPA